MAKLYINCECGQGIETIDTAENRKEARFLRDEYRTAGYGRVWISTRATKDWYNDHKAASK